MAPTWLLPLSLEVMIIAGRFCSYNMIAKRVIHVQSGHTFEKIGVFFDLIFLTLRSECTPPRSDQKLFSRFWHSNKNIQTETQNQNINGQRRQTFSAGGPDDLMPSRRPSLIGWQVAAGCDSNESIGKDSMGMLNLNDQCHAELILTVLLLHFCPTCWPRFRTMLLMFATIATAGVPNAPTGASLKFALLVST